MSTDLKRLQAVLGYEFHTPALLRHALVHSSYANEQKKQGAVSNERLEFLGDSVLGVIVAEYLYRSYPEMPEGELSRLRASVVCEESLAAFADKIGLGQYLLLGHGEDKTGGRSRASVLSDAVEAIIAAIYLDSHLDTVRGLVLHWLEPQLSVSVQYGGMETDYKTKLQERVQSKGINASYRILEERGPAHNREFVAEVLIGGAAVATGVGKSKKRAEQMAAKAALEQLPAQETE